MQTRGIRLVIFPISLLVVGFLLIINDLYAAPNSGEERFHKLFLWKVSEELKLNVEEEKKLNQIVLNNFKERDNLKVQIQAFLKAMESAQSKKERESLYGKYKKALGQLKANQISELEAVHGVLGTKKTTQYIVLQNKLNQKLKALLSDPAKDSSKKTFAKPKIIEGQ